MSDAQNINSGGGSNTPVSPQLAERNRQRNHRPNGHERQGIFMHYLFLNLTLRYSSYFKYTSRRLIEFFSLLNALLMFFVLLYIHTTFVKNSGDCLNHVKDIWPQSGVLRVQISHNKSKPAYKLYFVKEPTTSSVSAQVIPYDVTLRYSSPLTERDIINYKLWKQLLVGDSNKTSYVDDLKHQCPNIRKFAMLRTFHLLKKVCPSIKDHVIQDLTASFAYRLASIAAEVNVEYRDDGDKLSEEILYPDYTDVPLYDPFEPSTIRDHYIIEYSSEFGFLRLPTAVRRKLSIPTLVVNLNPNQNECFGSGLKQYMLKTFLGYDDFLMSSIKKLAENDKSQGYLRNPVTGEYFRFVSVWVNHVSGIIAFSVMVIFTLIVSMLLRYSYHQIFMFMMEVLRILDTDIRLVFPIAPMLTIILALVGMEEIMTEFFHDSTVAFYVILLIWGADQFDAICLHTVIGRRHWVRFFFLYHFSFYIYNYKFNGQYSKLALFTSWLFILHSMLYFLHHFEIPALRRQMLIITEQNRLRRAAQNNGGSSSGNPPDNNNEAAETPAQSNEVIASEQQEAPSGVSSGDNLENNSQQDPVENNAFPEPTSENVVTSSSNRNFAYLNFFKLWNIDLYKLSYILIVIAPCLAIFICSQLTHSNNSLETVRMLI